MDSLETVKVNNQTDDGPVSEVKKAKANANATISFHGA